MKKAMAVVVWLMLLTSDSLAQNRFQPSAIHILGSNQVGDPLPLSRVFTQKAGELAISRWEFRDIGLSPNVPKLLEVFRQPVPVANVLTIAIGLTVIRATGVINLKESHIPFELFVEFIVTEGTTYPIPVGTRLATFTTRSRVENGRNVVTTVLDLTPGLLPEIAPTPISIAGQQTPGVVKNPCQPGIVTIETTFTSVRPPDGSEPLVHRLVQNVEIVNNSSASIAEDKER